MNCVNVLASVGRRWTGLLGATEIPEDAMTADMTFGSGSNAHLSTFNRGSEGSVTEYEFPASVNPWQKSNAKVATDSQRLRLARRKQRIATPLSRDLTVLMPWR